MYIVLGFTFATLFAASTFASEMSNALGLHVAVERAGEC